MKSCIFVFCVAMSFCAVASASIAFPQCPAIGANTGCEFLITVTDSGSTVAMDPNAPNNAPYDGSDDTLVGILNSSRSTLTSIPLSSPLDIFGFDGDGPCVSTGAPSACPYGPTGYEGPGVSFTSISADTTSGTVNFTPGLAPGASTWFGLEEALTTSQIMVGPTGGGVPEPGTWAMLATGLAALAGLRRRYQW